MKAAAIEYCILQKTGQPEESAHEAVSTRNGDAWRSIRVHFLTFLGKLEDDLHAPGRNHVSF
jgi:hypothetical protein